MSVNKPPISIQSLSPSEASTLFSIARRCIGPFTGAALQGTSYILFTKDETFAIQFSGERLADDGTQTRSIHGITKTSNRGEGEKV